MASGYGSSHAVVRYDDGLSGEIRFNRYFMITWTLLGIIMAQTDGSQNFTQVK